MNVDHEQWVQEYLGECEPRRLDLLEHCEYVMRGVMVLGFVALLFELAALGAFCLDAMMGIFIYTAMHQWE